MRAGIAIRHSDLTFDETMIPLRTSSSKQRILARSRAGKLPILIDGETICDSLAICEYLAEAAPTLWPTARSTRAQARAVAAEMHSGFSHLRSALPMNLRAIARCPVLDEGTRADIQRVEQVWQTCRAMHHADGPWLFGRYSIADAMYAPVVSRFVTYQIELTEIARHYVQTTVADPNYKQWSELARAEADSIAAIDALI